MCLNIKTLNHEDSFLYSALMYSGYTALRYCSRVAVGVGVLLFSLLDMDSCVSQPVPLTGPVRGVVGWGLPEGFVVLL